MSASNACDLPVEFCLPVSNLPLPSTQLPDEVICYNFTPYEWPEEPNTILAAPGLYNLTSSPYVSYLGCDSTVKQKIRILPLNQVNLPLRYLCKNECYTINGLEYCETGSYQEYLTTDQGCDSVVNFSLFKIISKAVVVPPDTITCAVTSVPLSGVGSTTGNTVSYRWLNPAGQTISNTITATATEPGQFALIVTNFVGGNACMDTAFVDVPGNLTPPMVDAGPDKVLTCNVTQVTLQGSGSSGPDFSYFWKSQLGGNIVSGATTLNPIVNATGTYTLRVTNNYNGCTAVSNAVVTAQITPPVVTAAGGTFTCNNPNITLQVSTNAPSPSYSWTGPENFISSAQNPSVNIPGVYTVVVTNGITGCTASASATVNAGNDTPDVAATGGDITCNQSSVTLNGLSSVPGVTYQWNGPNGYSSSTQNPVVTAVGNYQLVVRAPNGCTNTAVAIVALNTTPPGTTLAASGSLNCNNNAVNVLATSNGNPSLLTHVWTLPNGANQNTGAVAFLPATTPGVYSVLVNNTATGCTSTASFEVVQYTNVSAAINQTINTNCFDSNDGSLSVLPSGGNGTYTYNWSNGATTQVNGSLAPGTYFVTVSDTENCTSTASGVITAPTAVNTNAVATPQTANGSADGTASAAPTGGTPGYTYNWSNGAISDTITGLLPGSYTVTVTDANGCTAVKTVNVSQFDCLLQTELVVANISCNGNRDGLATVKFLGGLSPFALNWSNGATTDTISGLAVGQYAVSITDAANCPQVQSFSITEPALLEANASGSTTTGPGSNDGTATANPTGGFGAYSFTWSNGATTSAIDSLAAGNYTVTVQDENGCQSIQMVEVVAGNCNLTTDLQLSNPTCSGQSDGAATILLTGGAGGFSYAWSTGGTSATESDLPAGVHTVTVTDANGCFITVDALLSAPAPVTVVVESVQNTPCPDAPEGAATVLVSGGSGLLTTTWDNGQFGITASQLVAGVYTATTTDVNGCTGAVSVTVNSNDTEAPVIVASNTDVSIGPDGIIVLAPQNMNATVTDNCQLASVVINPSEFNCLQLGEHVVTITATDDAGNTTADTVTLNIVDTAPPVLVCSPSLVLCFKDNTVNYQAPTATDNCLVLGGMFNLIAGLPIGATFPIGSTTNTYNFTDAQGNVGMCSFEVTVLSDLDVEVDTVINDFNFQSIGAVSIDVAGSLPPYTYSWKLNGVEVAATQDLTGVPGGNYTLLVTDDNGCTYTQVITVESTSATKTPSLLDGILVFPNPTSGQLSVLLPDALVGQQVFLQIFDQTGRRVMDQNSLQTKQIDLTLLGLSDGLYSLVLRIENNQVVRKIVLNR